MSDIKYMDIKEFVDGGYLQEVNRRFLHLLGLAIEVYVDDDGNFALTGLVDFRDDAEGIVFDSVDTEHVVSIQNQLDKKIEARQKAFGWFLQPYEIAGDTDAS